MVQKEGVKFRDSGNKIEKNVVQKGSKVCHLRMGIYIWNYYDLTKEKVSTGMVVEKVTVISSFLTWPFFCY